MTAELRFTTTFRNIDVDVHGEGQLLYVENTEQQVVLTKGQRVKFEDGLYQVDMVTYFPKLRLTVVQLTQTFTL